MTSKGPAKEILQLHPLGDQFVGKYKSENNVIDSKAIYQTIIIMDRSGSMGQAARRLAQIIFPLTFDKMSYQPSNLIHLITFDSVSELHAVTVEKFGELPMSARGETFMRQAIKDCHEVFNKLDSNKPVRLLTISDGEVADQVETEAEAISLKKYLEGLDRRFMINSSAVRLFTSSAQPDTKAISSLLQINNGPSKSLCEVSTRELDDFIATTIAALFSSDNHDRMGTITSPDTIFKQYPWEDQTTKNLPVTPGENLVFTTKAPKDLVDDNGQPIDHVIQPPLTADEFEGLIRSKFEQIVEQIKVLQVIDSDESKASIEKIKEYFKNTEKLLPPKQYVIENSSIDAILELAENDTVGKMSQKEKAEYLLKSVELPPAKKVNKENENEAAIANDPYKQLKKILQQLFAFVENLLPPEYKQHVFFVVTAVFFVFAVGMLWVV